MKKISSMLAATLVTSTMAVAHGGFYFGAKIGPTFNTGNFVARHLINNSTVQANGGAGDALLAGGNIGYSWCNSALYLALDLNAFYHSLKSRVWKINFTGIEVDGKLKNNFLYGAAIHVGHKFHNGVIPYISLGVTGGKYKVTLKSGITSGGLPANTTANFSKTIAAFTPGIGVKVPMSKCGKLTMGMHYEVMFGPRMSKVYTQSTTDSWRYSQKLTQHTVLFSVNYRM